MRFVAVWVSLPSCESLTPLWLWLRQPDVLMFVVPAQKVMEFGCQPLEGTVRSTHGPVATAGVPAGAGAGAGGGGGHARAPTDGNVVLAATAPGSTTQAAPWQFVQAKLGIVVHVNVDGTFDCPRSLAAYRSIVDVKPRLNLGGDLHAKAVRTAFHGLRGSSADVQRAIVAAFKGAATLDVAVGKLCTLDAALKDKVVSLLKQGHKRWCFKQFELDHWQGGGASGAASSAGSRKRRTTRAVASRGPYVSFLSRPKKPRRS